MDGQLTLNMVRITDPDTSRAAAVLALETAETLRGRCLQALRAAGEHGLTDFETAEIVGVNRPAPANDGSNSNAPGSSRPDSSSTRRH